MRISVNKIQLVRESCHNYSISPTLLAPDDSYEAINAVFHLDDEAQEVVVALFLNFKNKIVGTIELSRGSVNCSIVSPPEIFKAALLHNASKIILAHNHPSGDTTPSAEDINTTKTILKGGEILKIELLDHLIIGDGGYTSLKEEGFIK